MSDESQPVHKPIVAYLYTTLAAHPGKVFRVRHEEVDPKTLVEAFAPTQAQVDADWHNKGSLIWPREEVKSAVNTCAPEPPPRSIAEPVYVTEGLSDGKSAFLPPLRRIGRWFANLFN